MHKAMRLNPHYPDWYLWYLADAYDTLGQSEDVIATIQRMHDPSEGQRMLAANYAHLGMMREAEAATREARGGNPPRAPSRRLGRHGLEAIRPSGRAPDEWYSGCK